jgi:hypothetical protein
VGEELAEEIDDDEAKPVDDCEEDEVTLATVEPMDDEDNPDVIEAVPIDDEVALDEELVVVLVPESARK